MKIIKSMMIFAVAALLLVTGCQQESNPGGAPASPDTNSAPMNTNAPAATNGPGM